VPPVVTPPVDDVPEIEIVDTRPKPPFTPEQPPTPTPEPPFTPEQPPTPTPEPPFTPEQPPTPEPPTPPVVEPPYVAPPIYVPPIVPPTVTPPYGPITPLDWGKGVPIDYNGLNPGYITNVPAQYAPSGVRSQYYYGQKPYQTGGTTGQVFDPTLYRSAPAAPVTPWGLQQMYNPQTQTIENLLRGVRVASAVAPYNVPRAPKV
jgi:hypothetical protein